MTAIRATLDNGNLLLDKPLPLTASRLQALVIISDAEHLPQDLPVQKLAEQEFTAEEEFEAIGLKDFFGDTVDEQINWDIFFGSKILLDFQMHSSIRKAEGEAASSLF
jgi:hypothetical protein